MIQEDYCSFEISKLLKEKGFDWLCRGFYYKGREVAEPYFRSNEGIDNWNEQPLLVRDLWFSAPTHQMAMKWLREVHHIVMSISPTCGMLGQFNGYLIIIDKIVDGVIDNQDEFGLDTLSYKEAVEAALKYSLENLV